MTSINFKSLISFDHALESHDLPKWETYAQLILSTRLVRPQMALFTENKEYIYVYICYCLYILKKDFFWQKPNSIATEVYLNNVIFFPIACYYCSGVNKSPVKCSSIFYVNRTFQHAVECDPTMTSPSGNANLFHQQRFTNKLRTKTLQITQASHL